MEQIIHLEVDDDILTVRARLLRAQSKQVLLVVPGQCKALRRSLDMRLLHRQAAGMQLNLALVSDNAELRDLALEEGLTVFSRLAIGRRLRRRAPRWPVKDAAGMDGLVARLKAQRPGWWHWVLGPLAIVIVLAALTAGVLVVWPSATVEVTPAQETVGVSAWMEASPSVRMVDWDRLRAPARVVQIEVVDIGQVETTGVTNIGDAAAVGTVTLVNLTSRELRVPRDTGVLTSAGTPVRFRTVQDVVLGARARATVGVAAVEGGPSGNVRAYMINRVEGELAPSLRVTNSAATYGGTNEQVRRVTHGDKQRVSDLMITMLLQKGHAELSKELEGEFLPLETMWINSYTIRTNYDHHVDDQSDTLALEMRAVVGGLAVSEEIATEMGRRALERQVREGFHLVQDSVNISRADLIEVDEETSNIRFVVDAVAVVEADIDTGMLLKAIRGRSVEQAVAYMQQALPVETSPSLTVDPGWLDRVPWMVFRISIVHRPLPEAVADAAPGP